MHAYIHKCIQILSNKQTCLVYVPSTCTVKKCTEETLCANVSEWYMNAFISYTHCFIVSECLHTQFIHASSHVPKYAHTNTWFERK